MSSQGASVILQNTTNASLAYTRSSVLESRFVVVNAMPHEAMQALRSQKFDAVLFCSSVSWTECQRLTKEICSYSDTLQIMRMAELVGPNGDWVMPISSFDPENLVETVEAALQRRKRPAPMQAAHPKTKASIQR